MKKDINKMTYENFLKVVLTLQKQSRVEDKAYKLGLDLVNFVDPYNEIITVLIREIYGEGGVDWFSWFCYENDFGQKGLTANDENGNPICYSHESLWEYLESNYTTKQQ